jgi:hypothetical protein|nr:MAG TPA: tail assembly chaperone protein [Caudoviricetes sp.]
MMKERRVVTLPLPYAIYQGDNEITELSIVEPRFSDYKAYGFIANGENINMDAMFDLARKCTGLPPSTIDQLESPEITKVISVLTGFFEPSDESTTHSS